MRYGATIAGYFGVVLFYCLINLLFFLTSQPYRSLGNELLTNGDFSEDFAGWSVQGESSRLSLQSSVLTIDHPVAASTTLAQCWPAETLPQPLLLSAEGRSDGVVHGSKPWHQARIDLVGYDVHDRGQYQVRTRLLSLEGDRPWQAAKALFRLPAVAQRVCLEISLYTAPGRFQARHLSLTQGVESTPHRIGRWLLLAGWAVMAIWLVRPLYRHYRHHAPGRWLLLVGLLILVGVLLPHELRQQLEEGIVRVLAVSGLRIAPAETLFTQSGWALWPAQWDLSKLSHLFGFALLAALLVVDRSVGLGRRVAMLLLLAVTTETLQFFVPLRTPRLSDLVVDSLGIAIGLGLSAPIVWLVYRFSTRRS